MRRVFRPGSEPPKQEEVLLHGKTGPCIGYPRPSAWCCQHPTAELECPSNNKATVNLGARKDDVVEEAISRACLLWFCGLFGNRITVLDKRERSNEEIGLDDKVKSKLILSGASAVIWLKFSMKHLCGLSLLTGPKEMYLLAAGESLKLSLEVMCHVQLGYLVELD